MDEFRICRLQTIQTPTLATTPWWQASGMTFANAISWTWRWLLANLRPQLQVHDLVAGAEKASWPFLIFELQTLRRKRNANVIHLHLTDTAWKVLRCNQGYMNCNSADNAQQLHNVLSKAKIGRGFHAPVPPYCGVRRSWHSGQSEVEASTIKIKTKRKHCKSVS